MTHDDLSALMRDIAEAAARCVGADPFRTEPHVGIHGPYFSARRQSVELAARAGDWRVKGSAVGSTVQTANPALNAAAVLALRERVQAQRDERARLLAADEAALDVIDRTALIYDAATIGEAVAEAFPGGAGIDEAVRILRAALEDSTGSASGPWERAAMRSAVYLICNGRSIVDACDAILRRRAAEAPQGGGQVVLPADVSADGAVTVRVPGREP